MKVLVQQSLGAPRDYVQIDSSAWGSLPFKPVPLGGERVDNAGGWVFDLIVQGISFGGGDHYCVEDIADGGVRVTVWFDDPTDIVEADFWAEVWELLPLAPDARLGGAINTRQSRVVYAQPAAIARRSAIPIENTEYRPWSEFRPPAQARHGIWLPQELLVDHEDIQTPHGWREWGEGGVVPSQRLLGRYAKPEGTITYFLHDTVLATGVHVVEHEVEMEETDVAVPVNLTGASNAGGGIQTHVWTTLSGSPNDADWPSGDYRCQIDVNQIMRVDSYGFRTLASVAGHFARVNTGLTADQETFEQIEAAFTGTGIKLATTGTINPASGSADDRAEWVLVADATSESMAGSVRVSCDDSDSFADGPWTAALDTSAEEFAGTRAEGQDPHHSVRDVVAY